jgi:hypothetical protein
LPASIDMKYRSKIPVLLLVVLSLAACGKKAVYVDESFSNDSPFKLRVDGDTTLACESARRSLLGQGYLIDLANSDEVKGRKATRGENTFIEMNVVCVPESSGSTIFAAGVLSTYDLKKNSSSASVGLSALGSISLPIGQSVDSLVKVSEETIDDKEFYKRFFTAVDTVLDDMAAGKASAEAVEEPVEEPVAVESAPLPTQSAIWPELFPEQAEPAIVPDPVPAQAEPVVVPETVPETVPFPAEPAAAPDTIPLQAEPAPLPEAVPVESAPPVTPSVPAAAEGSSGAVSLPLPDEEPLGISPEPAPDNEPMGIPAQTLPAKQVPAARDSDLAPIETTAVKKVMPKPTTAVQETPATPPASTPASAVDELF